MDGCRLTVERFPSGAVCVVLGGELDRNHAYSFDEELRRVEETRPPCIVLDLRQVGLMDSSGVGRLVAARRRARRAGRRLVLVRGSRAVQDVLALTGLEEAFEIVGDVPDELRRPDAARVG